MTYAITRLSASVEGFTDATGNIADEVLARPYTWKDYDEGLREAFFRVYEEVRAVAAHAASVRAASTTPATEAQRIVAQYHAAYRDLLAVLLGTSDADLDRAPAAGQWPLRAVLEHIIEADYGFRAVVRGTLALLRSGCRPEPIASDATWAAFAVERAPLRSVMKEGLSDIRHFYAGLHDEIVALCAGVSDKELNADAYFWESRPFPLRFRLLRFDAHLRQHTIQAEKTLGAIGKGPTEVQRLNRHIAAALAEAEGALIGAAGSADARAVAAAEVVDNLLAEIRPLLA